MGGVKESVAFKFTKKQISVGRSHTRAHSRTVNEEEVIHDKDYSNEVANGFRRDMFISAFFKEKTTSINSFIMWDVSIQWRDIKRDKHIIHRHSNVLYSSDRCRNVFENLPLVAYRRCKNISHILVRAQLTNSTETSNSRPTPYYVISGHYFTPYIFL